MDGVPQQISREEILNLLLENPNIISVHHLHIWALSSTQNAMTAHLVLKKDTSLEDFMKVKKELKHKLFHKNIQHSTFEIDILSFDCKEIECF